MRDIESVKGRLNKLIGFANAVTPQEHANLGALLVSAGAAILTHAGAERDHIEWCVESGIRAELGQPPLPVPGTGDAS